MNTIRIYLNVVYLYKYDYKVNVKYIQNTIYAYIIIYIDEE